MNEFEEHYRGLRQGWEGYVKEIERKSCFVADKMFPRINIFFFFTRAAVGVMRRFPLPDRRVNRLRNGNP
jgi:hypothetical protein